MSEQLNLEDKTKKLVLSWELESIFLSPRLNCTPTCWKRLIHVAVLFIQSYIFSHSIFSSFIHHSASGTTTATTAGTQPSQTAATPPPPQYAYHEINVSGLSGLAPHIQINPQVNHNPMMNLIFDSHLRFAVCIFLFFALFSFLGPEITQLPQEKWAIDCCQ